MHIARVNKRDDWVHSEDAVLPQANTIPRSIPPDSGVVHIRYMDDTGTYRYWNGAAFVAGPELPLATTVSGSDSTYEYTHPPEVRNRIVEFYGHVVVNGQRLPTRHVHAYVTAVDHEGSYYG